VKGGGPGLGWVNPKSRPCPKCGAKANESCMSTRNAMYPKRMSEIHRERRAPKPEPAE
jgi:hypothetical protein